MAALQPPSKFHCFRTNDMRKSNMDRGPSGSVSAARRTRASLSVLVPFLGTLSIAGCGGVDAGNTAPVIQRFAASAPTIAAGQTTTLSWEADGAKSVSLSGVSATPAASAVVAPAETTTYRLTATNGPDASATRDVTVTVVPSATIGSVAVNPAQRGRVIPAGFLGFSHEWGQGQLLMGEPSNPNPIYRQLIANLEAYGGGPVSLRIGGSSTDSTGQPDATTVARSHRWLRTARACRPVFRSFSA
jgi:hypothetical protein